MIPKSFVQDLLSRVDIVDLIESYLPLKRAGANLVACCPFHNEKTASFTVSPTKQFYHCFGCGAHGSAIGFLMEHVGMGFVEAVKELAARAGMQVPEEIPDPRAARPDPGAPTTEALGELLARAAQFYKSELKQSERAINYLKGRGVSGEIAARFGLGYAPAGWQSLAQAFPDYGARALVDAGLVVQGEEGKRYDRFRDRVMFPIANPRGQIIGFGGRVLDHSEPKYLNSPETSLFEKGSELYGLLQARQPIRAAGRVLVVEGYMDVVALAQFEVSNAVATLGTATTPVHVQKLWRQADEIVFCFDGDAAGRRAAWRALENCLEQLRDGKQAKFLFLPRDHDPDTFVRSQGREALERALQGAVPLSTFLLKELTERVDMTTPEGRAKFLQDAKPLVKRVSAPMFGLMFAGRVAELAGLSVSELEHRFDLRSARRAPMVSARSERRSLDPYARLLAQVLAEPALLEELRELEFPAADSPTAEAAALKALVEHLRAGGDVPARSVAAEELLRMSGHAAAVQALSQAVADLEGFAAADLRVEVREAVRGLATTRALGRATAQIAQVASPREVSPELRAQLNRALTARGAVEKH